jgi:threonine dehydrogenase-like Zn-dependent dehydrogenase
VDVVVDNVGPATWVSSLRALAKGGRLLTVGGTTGYEATVPVSLLFGKHLSIIGSTMGTQADFEQVMAQVWVGQADACRRLGLSAGRVFCRASADAGRGRIRQNPGAGWLAIVREVAFRRD